MGVVRNFATSNGISIPKRKWYEPKFIFEMRYDKWHVRVYDLMENINSLQAIFVSNKQYIDGYKKLAEYSGFKLSVPSIPETFFFSNLNIAKVEVEVALESQKKYRNEMFELTKRCRMQAIQKFLRDSAAKIPQDKSIVVIKDIKYSPDFADVQRFENKLHELKQNLHMYNGYIYLNKRFIPAWLAFCPKTVDFSVLNFCGNIFTATVEYI